MEVYWQFLDYVSSTGRNQIVEWYERLSRQEQATFDQLIRNLARLKQWEGREFKKLTGKTNRKHRGLSELRFKAGNKQHRVIGYHGPAAGQYSLLIGCNHKGRIYDPPEALDSAARRRNEIQRGEAKSVEHRL